MTVEIPSVSPTEEFSFTPFTSTDFGKPFIKKHKIIRQHIMLFVNAFFIFSKPPI
jgi:hypothetical protein